MERVNDFSKGNMKLCILRISIPMMVAQVVNVLYSLIDRLYLSRMADVGLLAFASVGVASPIIMLISAFANLCGQGGAPLCSIARGKNDIKQAEIIMGNSFSLLLLFSILITFICFIWSKPILFLAGASDITISYAQQYLRIYVCGTLFAMISLGMNAFINSQGFGKIGMLSVIIGAILNAILDPIFIFVFQWGIQGAAIATVISQLFSALWVMKFLLGKKSVFKLTISNMRLKLNTVKRILLLGLSAFTMSVTNGVVGVAGNSMLQQLGGDLYVSTMTIINSIRDMITMPATGLSHGSHPVIGYNFGAEQSSRVREGTRFITIVLVLFLSVFWILLMIAPEFAINIFSNDKLQVQAAIPCVRIYFCLFVFQSLQMSGQTFFMALGKTKQAIIFSILRKGIIVLPLIYLLPTIPTLGVYGVFWTEPISNILGGTACYITMKVMIRKYIK